MHGQVQPRYQQRSSAVGRSVVRRLIARWRELPFDRFGRWHARHKNPLRPLLPRTLSRGVSPRLLAATLAAAAASRAVAVALAVGAARAVFPPFRLGFPPLEV